MVLWGWFIYSFSKHFLGVPQVQWDTAVDQTDEAQPSQGVGRRLSVTGKVSELPDNHAVMVTAHAVRGYSWVVSRRLLRPR